MLQRAGRLLVTAAWLTVVEAQVPGDDFARVVRLARIKSRMAENLQQLPNYTCVETIERSRRLAGRPRFELLDVLRMEVALVGGKELYTWPGGRTFEDRELRQMVGTGAISNGDFALNARSIFLGNIAEITADGEKIEQDRRHFAYRYNVPLLRTDHVMRLGTIQARVAYNGSFFVDTETLDLRHLVVQVDDAPPEVNLRQSVTTLEYERMPIGESSFLLPKASDWLMTDLSGNEHRNRTTISACRQYTGQSTLRFDDPPPEAPPAAPEPALEVPAGVTLDIRLETAIRPGAMAVGEEFQSIVASDVKRQGKVVVPKGSLVFGRLIEIGHPKVAISSAGSAGSVQSAESAEGLSLTLELTRIESGGRKADLQGELQELGALAMGGTASRAKVPQEPKGRATILVTGRQLQLPKGFRMIWLIPGPGTR